jgi:hypothetical protein
VLVCPTWGIGAVRLFEWCHRFAHELAQSGIATVVPHWPGTQDSEGDPNDITLDRLVDAGVDAAAAAQTRCTVPAWGIVGIGVGASAAALVSPTLEASRLALVQPALDLVGHFAESERRGRRAQLGSPTTPEWAFGHPHPPGLRRDEDTARVRDAIESFSGKGAVVRYRRPRPQPAPAGFRTITVWGDYLTPPRVDDGPLRIATTRWLLRSVRGMT